MTILYFTGTGNSLAVAKRLGALCDEGKARLFSIPRCIKSGTYRFQDEVIGLVFPTYCCYIPRIVREFLSKAELEAGYLFAIATYGNTLAQGGDGSEMPGFSSFAAAHGHRFAYLDSVLMVDNFLDVFDIGREVARLPSKKIDERLALIASNLQGRIEYVKQVGILGKAMSGLLKPLVKAQDRGDYCRKFRLDEKCKACGICAKVCPRGNIAVAGRPSFGEDCEGCYACIHACPRKAIHVKTEKNELRWRNPEVSLREIIEANGK